MKNTNNIITNINEHLTSLSGMIVNADYHNEEKKSMAESLLGLSVKYSNSNDYEEIGRSLSTVCWNYYKMRTYFINSQELFQEFQNTFHSLFQLRDELKQYKYAATAA